MWAPGVHKEEAPSILALSYFQGCLVRDFVVAHCLLFLDGGVVACSKGMVTCVWTAIAEPAVARPWYVGYQLDCDFPTLAKKAMEPAL
jgi:hypothetical protein